MKVSTDKETLNDEIGCLLNLEMKNRKQSGRIPHVIDHGRLFPKSSIFYYLMPYFGSQNLE